MAVTIDSRERVWEFPPYLLSIFCERLAGTSSWGYAVTVMRDGEAVLPTRRQMECAYASHGEAEAVGFDVGLRIVTDLLK